MSLEQWKLNGWLKASEAKLPEMTQLFAVVDREIHDASIKEISADGRFMHAYDAALNICAVALRASGYAVVKGQGHHKRTIASLPLSMGTKFQEIADQVEVASRLRGQAMYDRVDVVQDNDAIELLQTARELRRAVIGWLRQLHPLLLPTRLQSE